ncbi:APC family permease [Ornithinibacillus halotolerans]|uniref:Amino acid permease n=1 Tax=Ornithinibacillus halotolerans TaxID=1274357 RepID=A0A916RPW7_9BACI|nr:APC family permease [Ornithinibacillus halotolerans]GGA64646.1 amino acid permease [Ornithinibacillus halotolerans]
MEERASLNRTLKPHWVWAIALGSAIGWGAFVQPVNWMSTAGPLGVILGFVIGALLMILIAVSYGFLIKSFPVSGGEFAYAFASLGRTHAFICGWFLTLGYICIVALNASALALMFKFVFPKFVENVQLYQVASWNVYLPEIIIATVALAIFGYFNVKAASFSGRLQFIFCCVMIGAIVFLTFMVGAQPGAGLSNITPLFPTDTTAFAAIISIVAIAPWAYVGFDNVPQAAEEFNFSTKKAFGLIVFAIIAAAALYSLMIIATAMAAPWTGLVDAGYIWGTGTAIQELLGTTGLLVLVIALSMGIFTGLNGFILSSSRLLFAMARAKFIPEAFAKVHPKYKTPYWGIIFTVIIALFAPWFGREALLWVVDMSSVGVTIAYFYACYAAFSFFRSKNSSGFNPDIHTDSPFKKVFALLGMVASLVFLVLLLFPGSPAFLGVESRIALVAWIVLGLIFYLMKRKQINNLSQEELNYLILGDKELKAKKD